MSDASAPLPTTLAECHARLKQLAADNAAVKDVNTRHQATIDEQQATIDEQQALLQSLQRDLALMKRTLFGQRRERFEDPRQGLLFESAEVGAAGAGRVSRTKTTTGIRLRLLERRGRPVAFASSRAGSTRDSREPASCETCSQTDRRGDPRAPARRRRTAVSEEGRRVDRVGTTSVDGGRRIRRDAGGGQCRRDGNQHGYRGTSTADPELLRGSFAAGRFGGQPLRGPSALLPAGGDSWNAAKS